MKTNTASKTLRRLIATAAAAAAITSAGAAFNPSTAAAAPEPLTVSSQAAAINPNGTLELFASSPDGGLNHRWQTGRDSDWVQWHAIPGGGNAKVAAGVNKNGSVELFKTTTSGALFHQWQQTPGGNDWSNWVEFKGGQTTSLAVAPNSAGALTLFTVASDGSIWRRSQGGPDGGWSYSTKMDNAGTAKQVAAARNQNGRLELFAIKGDNTVAHRWEQTAGKNDWTGWVSMGRTATNIAVGNNWNDALEVFVSNNGTIAHAWQQGPNSGFSGWLAMDGVVNGALAVGRNYSGRLEVFASNGQGKSMHRWQQTKGTNNWTGWVTFDTTSTPTVTRATGTKMGSNPFPQGQCTYGAAEKWKAATGYYLAVNGNARYWADSAKSKGWTVVNTPETRAIVVFQPGVQGAGSEGHVAWVDAVRVVNGQKVIDITEMNANGNPNFSQRSGVAHGAGMSYILAP